MFQDVFQLQTPGGGGYGTAVSNTDQPQEKKVKKENETQLNSENKPALPASLVGRGSVFDYSRTQESA